MISLEDLRRARAELPSVVRTTPLLPCDELGAGVFLKCENLQVTGSYKARAAFTILNRLTPEQKRTGAALTSSGNFAGAFAYMGRLLGIPTAIVMMEKTSPLKIERTRRYGGEVVLCENRFEARFETLEQLRQERGLAVINHLEDELVPVGHGILGLEILDQLPDADVVLVPVSTGGLIAGVGAAVKQTRPSTRVIGVQPEGSNALCRSLQEGRVVRIPRVDTICDALTAEYTGELMFELVQEYVDEIVLVSDDDVREAIRFLSTEAKLVVEPGGAVTAAALLSGRLSYSTGTKVAAVLSGGNIAPQSLAAILDPQSKIKIQNSKIKGVSELALWVRDFDRALSFYRDLLGFEVVEIDPGRNAFLQGGGFLLVLFNRSDPGTKLASEYLERTGGEARGEVYHVAFKIDPHALDTSCEELRKQGLEVRGPIQFDTGRRSYFLEDPDEHWIELTDR